MSGFQTILHNVSEGPITVLLIITMPLCIAATALRFVATRRAGRSIGWEDICAALALVAFLAYGCLAIGGFAITGGVSTDEFTLDQAVKTSKMAYAAAPFFEINQFFAKTSLLIVYYRIFSVDRTFKVCTTILAVIQLAWFISTFFALIFMCVPVSKWWDVLDEEDGWCLNDAALLAAEETINSCLDFAMMALAIFMVRKLQIKSHMKRKLAFVFVAGGLSGILGFVKIVQVYAIPDENGKTNVTNGFWDLLQMAVTIFCCCAPLYKNILPPDGFWSRLKSTISSVGSTTRINTNFSRKKISTDHSGEAGLEHAPYSSWGTPHRPHGSDHSQYSWAEGGTQMGDEIPLREKSSNPHVARVVQIRQDVHMV